MSRHDPLPPLWAISDRQALGSAAARDGGLAAWAQALDHAGIRGLQIREKDLADRDLFALASSVRRAFPSGLLLVNGRVDIAIAAGADGVHLPGHGLPTAPLRRRFGVELLIGRSAHSPAEVAAARADGADYAIFGPVFATPAKARFGPPQGLERLAEACGHGLPVIAVGGMTGETFADVAAAGAAGAAGIRMFLEPERLRDLVAAAAACFAEAAGAVAAPRRAP